MSSLTQEAQIRRLEALLKAGVIDEATFRAQLARLQVATAPAAKAGETTRPEEGIRKRPARSDLYRAPYRFVPYAIPGDRDHLIGPEGDATGPIDEPKRHGLSARIAVTWTAESPLLIGDDQGNGVVRPMKRAEGGHFIPGPTLRGAIRSVAEIMGGGRLTQVNLDGAFGLRDFTHAAYAKADGEGETRYPVGRADKVRAAWLRPVAGSRLDERNLLAAEMELVPVDDWYTIEIDHLLSFFRERLRRGPSPLDFSKRMSLTRKYGELELLDGKRLPAPREHIFRFLRPDDSHDAKRVVFDRGQTSEGFTGHLVFSGPAPAGKKVDYVFRHTASNEARALTADNWKRFVRINSKMVADRLEAEGPFAEAVKIWSRDPGIWMPVFHVGEIDEMDTRTFAFGLARLFKVPHDRSLADVLGASRAGPRETKREDGKLDVDMVDTLFGHVHEQASKSSVAVEGGARKGRVAFSSARLRPDRRADVTSEIATVMMGPRASFAPFYLIGRYKDYSSPEDVRIAGRKRYPVRFPETVETGERFRSIKHKLEAQIEAIRSQSPDGRVSEKVVSRLAFLVPPVGAPPLVFESEIRLFNVTMAELGLVIAALTFAENEATYGAKTWRGLRHAIGRAKPFGAGQTKVEITGLRVEYNDGRQLGASIDEVATTALEAFSGHCKRELQKGNAASEAQKSYEAAIGILKRLADPGVGAELERKGKLDYLRLREFPPGANRPEPAYTRLRDTTKPNKERDQPADGDGPFLTVEEVAAKRGLP